MRIPLSIATTLTLATSLAAQTPPAAPSAAAMTAHDSALHALNRLAYGPRPGDVDSVARFGVMRWIERQLDPDHLDDKVLEQREHAFKILDYDRGDLAQRYRDAQRERQRMQRELAQTGDSMRPDKIEGPMRAFRELGGELQQLAIVRATLSERQLREVMVDFWTNHFNVFVGKGADRFLLPSYIEQTIRPRVLGRFEDLLMAPADRHQRELRARAARAAHPRRRRRIHATGRHRSRPHFHRLEHRAPGPRRGIRVPRLGPRSWQPGRLRPHLPRRRKGRGRAAPHVPRNAARHDASREREAVCPLRRRRATRWLRRRRGRGLAENARRYPRRLTRDLHIARFLVSTGGPLEGEDAV